MNSLFNCAKSSSNSIGSDKFYSIDLIKSLNNKINYKLSANALHNCQNALIDIYNGSGYNMQYSSARSSSSSNGSTSNSTTGSLAPFKTDNQSMLSSLLLGMYTKYLLILFA